MTTKELKNIAPILASMQNKGTGFKVPETYFDTVETALTDKIVPASLPNHDGYIIPENYFDSVEKKVFSKLGEYANKEQRESEVSFDTFEDIKIERITQKKENKIFSIKKHWIPVAVAASLVLLFSIYNPFAFKKNTEIAEVTQWIEAGNLDLDSYEIAEFFGTDLESLELENTINTESLENYIKEEISEELFYN